MYEATILQLDQPIWLAEIMSFTFTKLKATFQAFYLTTLLRSLNFLGGWMLGPKDLEGPSIMSQETTNYTIFNT